MQRATITSRCYFTRYNTFSLSLVWFGPICNALPRVIVKFIKSKGNAWFRVANSPKPGKSQRKYTVTSVVTCSSYGNARVAV